MFELTIIRAPYQTSVMLAPSPSRAVALQLLPGAQTSTSVRTVSHCLAVSDRFLTSACPCDHIQGVGLPPHTASSTFLPSIVDSRLRTTPDSMEIIVHCATVMPITRVHRPLLPQIKSWLVKPGHVIWSVDCDHPRLKSSQKTCSPTVIDPPCHPSP